MIKANELRIGNYILYLNEIYIVQGLKYEVNAPSEKWRVTFSTIDGKLTNAKTANWINPIPLTPEILEKWCGLRSGSDCIHCNNFFLSIAQNSKGAWEDPERYEGIPYEPINYLHQLQNLFFALTGTELTVTIPAMQPA